MKFHITLPNCMHVPAVTQPWEHALSGADIIRVARLADELGFTGAFLPEKRGRMADEYLAAIHELFHNERPSFEGEFVSFTDVAFGPLPVSKPHPPIWMGGDADAVVRRAARWADGWAPWLTPPEELPAKLDLLRSSPGFDDRPFTVFYSLAVLNIGLEHEVRADPRAVASSDPQEVIDQCGMLADLGVTDTWVAPPPVSGLDAYMDHMRWVAERVVPALA